MSLSITLNATTLMLLSHLVLVAVIEHEKAKDKKGLIDYNAHVFQDALTELLARPWENQQAAVANDQPGSAAEEGT